MLYNIENYCYDRKKDYLLQNIEHYLYNQLSYEDMLHHQKYLLIDEVGEVMVKKVNMFGVNTLNSIEKSIWDIHTAKQKRNGLTS